MKLIWYHVILVIVTDMSVNGQRNSNRQEQNYEYYYYDDEYYYADDELLGNSNNPLPARLNSPTSATPVTTKTTSRATDTDSLSEAKEAIAQYDIDELVKAWREYMEEKEHKENQKQLIQGVTRPRQSSPTGNRRPRPTGQHRLTGKRPNGRLRPRGHLTHTAPRRRHRTTTTTTALPPLQAEDIFYYEYEYDDDQYQCPPRDQSYSTPDPVQCDK
jgi:hypothetical protein